MEWKVRRFDAIVSVTKVSRNRNRGVVRLSGDDLPVASGSRLELLARGRKYKLQPSKLSGCRVFFF